MSLQVQEEAAKTKPEPEKPKAEVQKPEPEPSIPKAAVKKPTPEVKEPELEVSKPESRPTPKEPQKKGNHLKVLQPRSLFTSHVSVL